MKRRELLMEGMALSAGPALVVAVYASAKNADPSWLLFFALFLIFVALIGYAISHFAVGRLMTKLAHTRISSAVIFIFYSLGECAAIGILYDIFVTFQIPYGYFLLPTVIDLAGALILLVVVKATGVLR